MKKMFITALTLLLYSKVMNAQNLPNVILKGRVIRQLSDFKTPSHIYFKLLGEKFYRDKKIKLQSGDKYRLDIKKENLQINSLSEIQFTLDTLIASRDEACLYTVKVGSILHYAIESKMDVMEVNADIPLQCTGMQGVEYNLAPFQMAFVGTYGRIDSLQFSTLKVNEEDRTFTLMLPTNNEAEFSQIIGKWNIVQKENSENLFEVILTSQFKLNPKFNTRLSYQKTETFQAMYYPDKTNIRHPMGIMTIQPKGNVRFESY